MGLAIFGRTTRWTLFECGGRSWKGRLEK